jgi:hypothetical protein
MAHFLPLHDLLTPFTMSSLLHGVLTPHGSCTLFSVLYTLSKAFFTPHGSCTLFSVLSLQARLHPKSSGNGGKHGDDDLQDLLPDR